MLTDLLSPPLLQTICQKTPKESTQYEECKKALQAVSKVCATPPPDTRRMLLA